MSSMEETCVYVLVPMKYIAFTVVHVCAYVDPYEIFAYIVKLFNKEPIGSACSELPCLWKCPYI